MLTELNWMILCVLALIGHLGDLCGRFYNCWVFVLQLWMLIPTAIVHYVFNIKIILHKWLSQNFKKENISEFQLHGCNKVDR
jgi:uncharacterized membrane protein AbrB (regulator of aidB expression)